MTEDDKPKRTPLERAERRVLRALTAQTVNLETYPSTPHTEESQRVIITTLEILDRIKQLQGEDNGNSQDQDPHRRLREGDG
jgi:hypothetical protein